MTQKERSIACVMICIGLVRASVAAEPAAQVLKVGDRAPAVAAGKWVKGDAVSSFEAGKIYVVEFWATWSGPSRDAVLELSRIQNEYAKNGLIIIGQNVFEEDESKVDEFMKEMGDKISFRVATDRKTGDDHGKMAETWMGDSGRIALPCAFVVDAAGKIAWIGHPLRLEPVLQEMLAGKFDPVAAATANAAAFQQFKHDLSAALGIGHLDQALKLMDDFEKARPESTGPLAITRTQVLLEKKDYDAAYRAAAAAADFAHDDAGLLNEIAWMLVDTPGLEKRDLDLALKAATRANDLAKGNQAPILDTLARVYFERGQIDKAIELQTDAVKKAAPEFKAQIQEALDKYQATAKARPQ